MCHYAHRSSLIHVERAEDDGWLDTINGLQPIMKGNLIATNEFGNKFVVDENYFYDSYIPVRKYRKTKTTRKSPFETEYAKGYLEMGELVKQSNENNDNYIFDVKK